MIEKPALRVGEANAPLQRQLTVFLEDVEAAFDDCPPDVRKVLREVHTYLFDPALNVHHVCECLGLKNHNVSSRFKLCLGVGIHEYIERQRIEAAKLLLCHTDDEGYLIASLVGFEYVETFARTFRRQMGCTAGEYRQRARQADPQADLFAQRPEAE